MQGPLGILDALPPPGDPGKAFDKQTLRFTFWTEIGDQRIVERRIILLPLPWQHSLGFQWAHVARQNCFIAHDQNAFGFRDGRLRSIRCSRWSTCTSCISATSS